MGNREALHLATHSGWYRYDRQAEREYWSPLPTLSENMQGGVMDMCAGGLVTADGEVVEIEPSGRTRTLIDGLPCITAIALGA